jgi:hypothetical protein
MVGVDHNSKLLRQFEKNRSEINSRSVRCTGVNIGRCQEQPTEEDSRVVSRYGRTKGGVRCRQLPLPLVGGPCTQVTVLQEETCRWNRSVAPPPPGLEMRVWGRRGGSPSHPNCTGLGRTGTLTSHLTVAEIEWFLKKQIMCSQITEITVHLQTM